MLKETVPEFEVTVKKYLELYPDSWLIAEDQKTFYIVRPITRLELKELAKLASSEEDLADLVLEKCIVYPELQLQDILKLKAGTAKNLLETIMAISNFSTTMPVVKL